MRFLSPIVPLKLLNFSAHMTVSQGRVRTLKEKADMQHTRAHGSTHMHIKTYTHWRLREICLLFTALTSVFSVFLSIELRNGEGRRRTRGERGQ